MQNPFKPTAGATPPVLIGREGLLDEFEYGLRQGSGAPGLLTIITGSRGIGKTVMLSAAEGIAPDHGWAVISRTANPGSWPESETTCSGLPTNWGTALQPERSRRSPLPVSA